MTRSSVRVESSRRAFTPVRTSRSSPKRPSIRSAASRSPAARTESTLRWRSPMRLESAHPRAVACGGGLGRADEGVRDAREGGDDHDRLSARADDVDQRANGFGLADRSAAELSDLHSEGDTIEGNNLGQAQEVVADPLRGARAFVHDGPVMEVPTDHRVHRRDIRARIRGCGIACDAPIEEKDYAENPRHSEGAVEFRFFRRLAVLIDFRSAVSRLIPAFASAALVSSTMFSVVRGRSDKSLQP